MAPLRIGLALLLIPASAAFAQESPLPKEPSPNGWKKFGQAKPDDPPPAPVPSTLVLPAGARIKVRTEDPLSSEQSRPGDLFSGTLAQPLIANGFVVAYRGQLVTGKVLVADKAGKVKGTSRLGLEITSVQLTDGREVPVKTQLIQIEGGTSKGRDAAAIGATSATGAAIGGAVGWGTGAAIGAAAGAAAGIIGVLATKGEPTVIPPEAGLVFRIEEPVTIAASRTPDAFPRARAEDYAQPQLRSRPAVPRYPPPYVHPAAPWYGPSYPYFMFGRVAYRRW